MSEAGRVAWKAQLDVYGVPQETRGEVAEAERTENPWRYPGQYEDAETGLYYNRFRYYDPESGRYVSEDPIGLEGGLGLHGYVHDPLGWVDPLGLARSVADLSDDELRARAEELTYRNKHATGGDGTHGLAHRIREQIAGAMRPGSAGWANHENAIKNQQAALRRTLFEAQKRGLPGFAHYWSFASAGPPTGRETKVPKRCR